MSQWTDEEFLGYVEIHSKTECALFHRDDVLRLIQLAKRGADVTVDWGRLFEREWFTLRWDVARELVEAARTRHTPSGAILGAEKSERESCWN